MIAAIPVLYSRLLIFSSTIIFNINFFLFRVINFSHWWGLARLGQIAAPAAEAGRTKLHAENAGHKGRQ